MPSRPGPDRSPRTVWLGQVRLTRHRNTVATRALLVADEKAGNEGEECERTTNGAEAMVPPPRYSQYRHDDTIPFRLSA